MATLIAYPNPPIVEVALEFVFDADLSDEAHQAVRSALGELYTGATKNASRVERDGTGSTAILMSAGRDHVALGIDVAMLTIHTTAPPYAGWGNITSRAEAGLGLYIEAYRPRGLKRLSVRYIDRILIPMRPSKKLSQYLTCLPTLPKGMAPTMAAFQVAVQSFDHQAGIGTFLTIGSDDREEADGETGPVLYDIIVEKNFEPPATVNHWVATANELHKRQREIFEASITEQARRLFQ